MDDRHFDHLARVVVTSGSRRRVLAGLLAGAWGSLRVRTTAADESGTAIADASGGNHNRAILPDEKDSDNDHERDRDRDHDRDRDNNDNNRDGNNRDGGTTDGHQDGPACAVCGLVEAAPSCDSGEPIVCDTSTADLCCQFGQDVECCVDCSTRTPLARCCTPGVDCAPDGGPCAGPTAILGGSVGCQCADDTHCIRGAYCSKPCTPGAACSPDRGICTT